MGLGPVLAGSALNWSAILLYALPTRTLFARWIHDKNLLKVAAGLFLGSWTVLGLGHVLAFGIIYARGPWPEDVWRTSMPIIHSLAALRCVAGTVLGVAVIALMRARKGTKPKWAIY